jgi:hypothetical protein
MRRPALSGPENAERDEYVRQASGRNNKGIRNSSRAPLWLDFPPLDRNPFPVLCADPNPNRSCLSHQSPPFQVAVPPKWIYPERIRRWCAAAKSKWAISIGSHSTYPPPLSYCYCKGGEGRVAAVRGVRCCRTEVHGGSHRFRGFGR